MLLALALAVALGTAVADDLLEAPGVTKKRTSRPRVQSSNVKG